MLWLYIVLVLCGGVVGARQGCVRCGLYLWCWAGHTKTERQAFDGNMGYADGTGNMNN